jgi:hypothetical protein
MVAASPSFPEYVARVRRTVINPRGMHMSMILARLIGTGEGD